MNLNFVQDGCKRVLFQHNIASGEVRGRRKGAELGDGGMNAKLIKMFPLEKNHMQVLLTSTADISPVQMVDKISLHVSTRNF